MTTLSGYINIVSKNKLTWYMEQNKTKEEEGRGRLLCERRL